MDTCSRTQVIGSEASPVFFGTPLKLASFPNLWKSMFLPVVVEYLREYARMTIEEILVEDGVVIGQGFGQPRQPQVRSLILNFALPAFYNQGPLKHFSVVFRESVRRNASDCFSLTFSVSFL